MGQSGSCFGSRRARALGTLLILPGIGAVFRAAALTLATTLHWRRSPMGPGFRRDDEEGVGAQKDEEGAGAQKTARVATESGCQP